MVVSTQGFFSMMGPIARYGPRIATFPGVSVAIVAIAAIAVCFDKAQRYCYQLDHKRFAINTELREVELPEREVALLNKTILKFQSVIPLMKQDSTRFCVALKSVIEDGEIEDLMSLMPIYKLSNKVFVGDEDYETPIVLAMSLGKWDMAKAMLKEKKYFSSLSEDSFADLNQKDGIEHILKRATTGRFYEVKCLIESGLIDPNTEVENRPLLAYIFESDEAVRGDSILRSLVRVNVDLQPDDSQSIIEMALKNGSKHKFLVTLLEELNSLKLKGALTEDNRAIIESIIDTNFSCGTSPLVYTTKLLMDENEEMDTNTRSILNLLVCLSSEDSLTREDGNEESIMDMARKDDSLGDLFLKFRVGYEPVRGNFSPLFKSIEAASSFKFIKAESPSFPSEITGCRNESGNDCFFNSCLQMIDQDLFDHFDPKNNPIVLTVIKKSMPKGDTYRKYLETKKLNTDKKIKGHLDKIQKAIFTLLKSRRDAGSELLNKNETTKVIKLLHENGFIEATPGAQEDTALVFNELIHKLLLFTRKRSDFELTHIKSSLFTSEMLSEKKDWKKGASPKVLEKIGTPWGESLYIIDEMGSDNPKYITKSEESMFVNKIRLTAGVEDYSGRSLIHEMRKEKYKEAGTRYISTSNESPEDTDKHIHQVSVFGVEHHHTLDIKGKFFACHLLRGTEAGLGYDSDSSTAKKCTFPVTFTDTKKKPFALSSFSMHSGGSASSGHYLAGRLVFSEDRRLWEWHICSDASTKRLESGSAATLDKVTLPKGQVMGYDIESLLKNKATMLMYKRQSEFKSF